MSTASVTDFLGDHWPEIAPPIERALRRRGIGADEAADIAQEVAERALRTGEPFASAQHLLRWGHVVAGRIAIDRHRKLRPLVLGPVPEEVAPETVEATVIAAETGERLRHAVASLSPAEQAALFTEHVRGEGSATRVRRHRARAKIARLLALVVALGGVVSRLLRRARDSVVPVAVAAPMLVGLSTSWLPSSGNAEDRDGPPVVVDERPVSELPRTAPRGVDSFTPPPAAGPTLPDIAPSGDLPAPEIDVSRPDSDRTWVRTNHAPDATPTLCVFDLAVVGDYCTPL